jgi:hypothetical protein
MRILQQAFRTYCAPEEDTTLDRRIDGPKGAAARLGMKHYT